MIRKQSPFELLDPQALEWIQTRSLKLATEINKTTKADLQRVLSQGFERGDSIQQMTQNISGYFDGAKYRAERVARTETIAASNEGALHRYETEGVGKSEFYPSPDACSECASLAGEYPTKESHNKIPVHPNCRCVWLPVIDSTKPVMPEKPTAPEGIEWRDALSKEEKEAVKNWSGTDYTDIRKYQKTGRGDDYIKQVTQNLENALNKDGAYDGVAWRGASARPVDYKELLNAKEFKFNAFSSASTKSSVAQDFLGMVPENRKAVLFKIHSKTAVDISKASKFAKESEVLIRHDKTFKIINKGVGEISGRKTLVIELMEL